MEGVGKSWASVRLKKGKERRGGVFGQVWYRWGENKLYMENQPSPDEKYIRPS